MLKGIILNVERFSIHDGPGIRTVIFMKGCPLRCLWCSTVESQVMHPQMEYIIEKCTRCGKCALACPQKAINIINGEIITDLEHCNNCGKCVEVCPNVARKIVGQEMTIEQVMQEIESDSIFYLNSGGGITLSGGEPTMQPEFSTDLLKICRLTGIHTAIETCGYVKWEIFNNMLKFLDLIYIDVKHMDPIKHQIFTTKTNELILDNIKKLALNYPDKQLIIRVPVIPGYNDSEENIYETAKFVRSLKNNASIELLPYHKLGISKYKALFKEYLLPEVEPPSITHMANLKNLIMSIGCAVEIGG